MEEGDVMEEDEDGAGLKIKKVLKSPFGDQVPKNSHQIQIVSCQIIESNRRDTIHRHT